MKKLIITDFAIAALVMMCCSLSACSSAEELGNLTSIVAEEDVGERFKENATESESLEETTAELVTEPEKIFVHVCGAVKMADVYELRADARIVDAIKMAGGFECDASADYINLASGLYDGMQIYVPTRQEVEEGYSGPAGNEAGDMSTVGQGSGAGNSGSGNSGISQSGKVNINTATEAELKTLNGIGDKRAKDIISYRETHGRFESIEDIKKVPGIKDAMYSRISEYIEV